MKKLILTAIAVVLISTASFAQKPAVQSAYRALNNGELADARTYIDQAAQDESTIGMPKTWVYRGKIYMAIAQDTTHKVKDVNAFDAINIAQQSFMKAADLDEKKDYKDDIVDALRTIAFIKFNAAVKPYNSKMYAPAFKLFCDVSAMYTLLNEKYNMGITDTSAKPYEAFAALQLKKYDTAKIMYNSLLNINYKKPSVFEGLELVALGQKDTAVALSYIREGRTLFPDNNLLMFDELNILLAQNKNDEVVAKIKEAIAKNPNSPELNYVLGNKYDRNFHDTTNAVKYYSEAIRIKPDYLDAYYSMGVMFFNAAVVVNGDMNKVPVSDQKKYDELKAVRDHLFTRSLPYMEKAYQIDPKDRQTLIALKQLYTYTNQKDKADKITAELSALGK